MYYPRKHDFRRMRGLAIALLTLGGVLSFGMGQALGHWQAHPATQVRHTPAVHQQQSIAGGSIARQEAIIVHAPAARPSGADQSKSRGDKHDNTHQGDNGQQDGHGSPSPKGDGGNGGGDGG
jgi:hypothetical protein